MAEWQAKRTNRYNIGEQEPHDNGAMMCLSLFDRGWCLEACSVLISYAFGLSGLNPWYWDSNNIPASDITSAQASDYSYGLFQFSPCTDYINESNAQRYSEWYAPNFSDKAGQPKDGEAQTQYFDDFCLRNWNISERDKYYDAFQEIGVDIDAFYGILVSEFVRGRTIEAKLPVRALVGAWLLSQEQLPADEAVNTYERRVEDAEYWLDYYTQHPPTPPEPPVKKKKKMPLYMMMWWY